MKFQIHGVRGTDHLTLERALQFEISKKMLVISLYWFAAQQQTSTTRPEKSGSVYSKFSVKESELTPGF